MQSKMCRTLQEGWYKKCIMKLQINKIHTHFKENCSGEVKVLPPLTHTVEVQTTAQIILPRYHCFATLMIST